MSRIVLSTAPSRRHSARLVDEVHPRGARIAKNDRSRSGGRGSRGTARSPRSALGLPSRRAQGRQHVRAPGRGGPAAAGGCGAGAREDIEEEVVISGSPDGDRREVGAIAARPRFTVNWIEPDWRCRRRATRRHQKLVDGPADRPSSRSSHRRRPVSSRRVAFASLNRAFASSSIPSNRDGKPLSRSARRRAPRLEPSAALSFRRAAVQVQ